MKVAAGGGVMHCIVSPPLLVLPLLLNLVLVVDDKDAISSACPHPLFF